MSALEIPTPPTTTKLTLAMSSSTTTANTNKRLYKSGIYIMGSSLSKVEKKWYYNVNAQCDIWM